MSQRGILSVGVKRIARALGFPEGVEIVEVTQGPPSSIETRVSLHLRGDGLPEVPDGEPASLVAAGFKDGKFVSFILDL